MTKLILKYKQNYINNAKINLDNYYRCFAC